ncbi:MAG: chemotaxis protein CheW [Verrucomicrobiota bacterium]|nr:chemotaxis protein CheW [Verrucomicrobiota bacterium]
MSTPMNESTVANLAGKYLAFTLGHESFALPVLQVREIIRFSSITPVPQMPSYFRGVINLRGKVIPIIDLRIKLGFDTATLAEGTCIFVVDARLPDDRITRVGLVVDAVEEVLNLNAADIDSPPNIGEMGSVDYILGLAKLKGTVKFLVDIDRIVTGDSSHFASALGHN